MKKLFLSLMILCTIAACKKDGPDPVSGFESIVGKWRAVMHSKDGGATNMPIPEGEGSLLIFRFDGVIVNEAGYQPCCSPMSFVLNGQFVTVEPKAPVEADPSCITVDCYTCEDLKITVKSESEMVTEYCDGYATRFVREK